ncbi:MAG: hypothetical protein L6437_07395 [Kiritimatiellae bacterium]|nr:hypothetical protein [Kiritimatiellia bacterium]
MQFLSIKSTIALITIAFFMGLFAATAAVAATPESRSAPRVEKMTAGTVELIITADPPQVHLDRDILLSIKTIAPSNITVRLPPLDNRLAGFTLSGAFDREPTARDGNIAHEHCFRLTPLMAAEYRLAPMAVTYTDTSRPNAPESWFATRALVFGVAPIGNEHPGASRRDAASIRDIRGPVWIYPAFKTVAGWMAILVLMAAAAWALYRLSRRIHRAIQLRRMSPRERALEDLADLMARDLISKNQIKEYFLELTLIVRRYIERAHSIRAPEQTTEEFLLAASRNPQFRPEVLDKLRAFLQTADLVKFAEYRPESAAVDRAFGTARDYVETDEQMTESEKNAQHPTPGYADRAPP